MSQLTPIRAIAVCLVSASLSAQSTWIVGNVHPAGPPDFADVPEAVAAASPGDTLLIGTGIFSPLVTNKGLTVDTLHLAPTSLQVTVRDLPAGQEFVLSDYGGLVDVRFENCLGTVRMHTINRGLILTAIRGRHLISDCALVTIQECATTQCVIINSRVVIMDSVIRGLPGAVVGTTTPTPALSMWNSDVEVYGGHLRGGMSVAPNPLPEVAGVEMTGGSLRLVGDVLLTGGISQFDFPQFTVLHGPHIQSDGGVVSIDAEVFFAGFGAPWTGTSQFTFGSSAWLQGETFVDVVRVHGTPGDSAWILVSFAAPPIATPFGEFWLDTTGSAQVIASSMLGPSGEFAVTHSLRNVLSAGQQAVFQAVTFDGTALGSHEPLVLPRRIPVALEAP